MPVKQDGTLHAATLKSRQVPDDELVDAPGAPRGRFIGTSGGLEGWDTVCRILQVTDRSTGRGVNDAVDVGDIDIIIEPVTVDQRLTDDDGRVIAERQTADQGQVKLDYHDGYFLDVVGPVPAGLPTSEHKPGASFADQHTGDTQPHLADFPAHAPEVPLQPGEPALHAVAGAGDHGEPVSDERKAELAAEAETQRAEAERLSQLGGGGAQPPADNDAAEREAAFTGALREELAATPDDLAGAISRAEDRTGLKVAPAEEQPTEPEQPEEV